MSLLKGIVQGAAQGFVDSAIGKFLGHSEGEKQGFSAQNIVASLSKSGVAHTGHFEVQLTGPKEFMLDRYVSNGTDDEKIIKTGLSVDAERDMIYRAESAELPGRSLATVDHRFDNYSPVSRVVTGQTYTDIAVTFLLSEDLREKEYFEKWQQAAVGTGAFSMSSADMTRNNPQYYDQYVGSVVLRQYGSDGTLRSVHKLEKAFPIVLGGVQMNWGDEAFARLAVSFSYNRYTAVFYNQNQAEKGMSGSFSLGPNGFAGSLTVPGLGSIGAGGGRLSADLTAGTANITKKIFG